MITIKNMKELPKTCRECPYGSFHNGIRCGLLGYLPDCRRANRHDRYCTVRHADCPLVEVDNVEPTDDDILQSIYRGFCSCVGFEPVGDDYLHGVQSYHFTEELGPHNIYSQITIEFYDGSIIKYQLGGAYRTRYI